MEELAWRAQKRGGLRLLPFNATRRVDAAAVGGARAWSVQEAEAEADDAFGRSPVFRLSNLLDRPEAAALLKVSEGLAYESGGDSVDKRPSFEAALFRQGRCVAPRQAVEAFRPVIEQRLLPYARERFGCPGCVACTSIVRRYLPGERRIHPWHYDSDAFVTIVVPLTPRDRYEGGLYLQSSSNFDRARREFFALEAGEAVLHNYDLLHGVEVFSGERVSLVVWLKTGAEACERETSPWYAESAERGDPRAQYNLARISTAGLGGVVQDEALGLEWYRQAAEQGHIMAMYNFAVRLHHGRGTAADPTAAAIWYGRAAKHGHPQSMTNFGAMHLYGDGGLEKNATEAAYWLLRAADQGEPTAMYQAGQLYFKGNGVLRSVAEAERWFQAAADQGSAQASDKLVHLQRAKA